MRAHFSSLVRKAVSVVMVAAVMIAFIPKITGTDETVLAEGTKNQDNTYLGISVITNPAVPEDVNSPWSGSYVYFGEYTKQYYGRRDLKFRVLQKDCTVYTSEKALFLDSDETLFSSEFDKESNTWEKSDLRDYLNTTFYEDSFSERERSVIATSTGNGNVVYAPGSYEEWYYVSPVSVNDKVFLLDAGEVMNEAYGYSSDCGWTSDVAYKLGSHETYGYHSVDNRLKSGKGFTWFLRSADPDLSRVISLVTDDGQLYEETIKFSNGVAPAINVYQKNIIFASSVGNRSDTFKLTFKDSGLKIAIQEGKKVSVSGTKVTVPYTITGTNADTATRASVLILDKEYKTENSNNANILYYDGLDGLYGKNGTGTFVLPASLKLKDWNTKYYVYILAEDINAEAETDFASAPVKLGVPVLIADPTPTKKPTATPAPTKEPTKKPSVTPTPVAGKKSTWSKENGRWYYYDKNGSKATGWYRVGSWYLFDRTGVMLTGWQLDGGKWFFLGKDGAMRSGWLQINGLWYYLDSSGAMKTGWQKIGTTWYYFKPDGSMAANEYCSGYWLNDNGSWTYEPKAKWYKNSVGWYYQDSSGWYAKSGTYKIDGKNYNFISAGYCTNP